MNARMIFALLLAATLLSPALAQSPRGSQGRDDDRRGDAQRGDPQRGDARRDDARRGDAQRGDDRRGDDRRDNDWRDRRVHTRGSVVYGRGGDRNQPRGRDNVLEPEHRDRWGHRIEFGQHYDRDRTVRIVSEINRRHPREFRPVPYGTCVAALPRGARTVVFGGTTYYDADGVFFAVGATPRSYVVVRPPVGVLVTAIPSDYQVVVIQDRPYYVYDDTYFDTDLHVVEVPVGGYVNTLPPRHDVEVVRGERYFSFSGSFYRPFLRDGLTLYLRVNVHR